MKRVGVVVVVLAIAGSVALGMRDRPPADSGTQQGGTPEAPLPDLGFHYVVRPNDAPTSVGPTSSQRVATSFAISSKWSDVPLARLGVKIDAAAALRMAQGDGEWAQNATPTLLALYTNAERTVWYRGTPQESKGPLIHDRRPIWVVTFDGTCIVPFGNLASHPYKCIPATKRVVVDATSGETIATLLDGTP